MNMILLQKTNKTLAVMLGCALCFFSVVGLFRSKLRQTGTGEETAFVPQTCITARKTLKTGWRSAWVSRDLQVLKAVMLASWPMRGT